MIRRNNTTKTKIKTNNVILSSLFKKVVGLDLHWISTHWRRVQIHFISHWKAQIDTNNDSACRCEEHQVDALLYRSLSKSTTVIMTKNGIADILSLVVSERLIFYLYIKIKVYTLLSEKEIEEKSNLNSKIYLRFLLSTTVVKKILLFCIVIKIYVDGLSLFSKITSMSKNMLYDIKTSINIKSSKRYYLGSQVLVMMYPRVKELTVIMFRFVILNAIECGFIE
ncbi:hypothetical protein RFI_19251 [Reticulomyxa filosa]|uniref:Uncharacterized protein n=1 Tax=Reticulomyxa filosa TaxID=46433 RepID=X6MX44_RETFI|nr:hypothetical protein RFI_19251 [Reticulomyxa filosa]|eukprot:ETO18047.1 hypothetical protein RFI_19251 [Reticulomyxa filosa]